MRLCVYAASVTASVENNVSMRDSDMLTTLVLGATHATHAQAHALAYCLRRPSGGVVMSLEVQQYATTPVQFDVRVSSCATAYFLRHRR
jgi:hypothetical protein